MFGMLLAEAAILIEFYTVRIISTILNSIIIALLAFRAGQSNTYAHI